MVMEKLVCGDERNLFTVEEWLLWACHHLSMSSFLCFFVYLHGG